MLNETQIEQLRRELHFLSLCLDQMPPDRPDSRCIRAECDVIRATLAEPESKARAASAS